MQPARRVHIDHGFVDPADRVRDHGQIESEVVGKEPVNAVAFGLLIAMAFVGQMHVGNPVRRVVERIHPFQIGEFDFRRVAGPVPPDRDEELRARGGQGGNLDVVCLV